MGSILCPAATKERDCDLMMRQKREGNYNKGLKRTQARLLYSTHLDHTIAIQVQVQKEKRSFWQKVQDCWGSSNKMHYRIDDAFRNIWTQFRPLHWWWRCMASAALYTLTWIEQQRPSIVSFVQRKWMRRSRALRHHRWNSSPCRLSEAVEKGSATTEANYLSIKVETRKAVRNWIWV